MRYITHFHPFLGVQTVKIPVWIPTRDLFKTGLTHGSDPNWTGQISGPTRTKWVGPGRGGGPTLPVQSTPSTWTESTRWERWLYPEVSPALPRFLISCKFIPCAEISLKYIPLIKYWIQKIANVNYPYNIITRTNFSSPIYYPRNLSAYIYWRSEFFSIQNCPLTIIFITNISILYFSALQHVFLDTRTLQSKEDSSQIS